MKQKFAILLILLIPLVLSGCFNKAGEPPQEEIVSYNIYIHDSLEQGGYKVKYPAKWLVEETSTGKFGDKNDVTSFKVSDQEEIVVSYHLVNDDIVGSQVIESQSQTQIDGRLANDYLVLNQENENQRLRFISIVSEKYLYLIESNNPGSEAFDSFINNLTFLEFQVKQPELKQFGNEVKFKLYFDKINDENEDCLASGYQEVIAIRPEIEIGLIPVVIKSLIQVSNSEELAGQNLASALPINTRILSFGYENNTAIVNFNDELNTGGGSCLMSMRRSQIERTLKALNDVSNLQINYVEIQVNGESETALQP